MAELRYNPLLDDWTMISANRAKRPDMPKDFCAFCVGKGKISEEYDVYKYDNDFPMLSFNPPKQDLPKGDFFQTAPSYGKCDVILYSSNHTASLHELSEAHIVKLVKLWQTRYEELSCDEKIKYIFPFENRGKEVGVTMPHPHGQIYAYSKMPLRIKVELANAKKHYQKTGENLYKKIRDEETLEEDRIIIENDSFIGFIPFFCEYPFGVYIMPKSDIYSFKDFDDKIRLDFAKILKHMQSAFDVLYAKSFPYMMCVYNSPVNSDEYNDSDNYSLFHVKFFPPLRGENSIKWNASSETGAWAAGNPRKVEETAVELRKAVEITKYLSVQEVTKMKQEYQKYYGDLSNANFYFAPSRINLIGEHIDYNGGKVLPCAISIGTFALVSKTDNDVLDIRSLNIDKHQRVKLGDNQYDEKLDWLNYPVGMIKYLKESGAKVGGLKGIIYGNIPNGAGLSSSASLEMLIGKIINDEYNDGKIDKLKLIKLGQQTENSYFSLMTGIMDQFAIGMGKENHAVLLDTATLDYSYVPINFSGHKIVIINTNKRRELKDSKYNERRAECREAAQIINKYKPCQTLCELDIDDLEKFAGKIADVNIRNRLIHVVSENHRVKEAVKALQENDLVYFGELLNQSHQSLKNYYDVTGLHLDTLYESSISAGAVGARMVGAGFGGCAIALVKDEDIQSFKEAVFKEYQKVTGLECQFFITTISNGTIKI